MAVGKRLRVLSLLTLSFACVPAATRAAESEAAPVAAFTISPQPAEVGAVVTFDGHESSDPDGTIASYGWKFGDAATGTGEVTHHTYAKTGEYNITLTVKDNEGASGTETKTLVVNGKPQKVTIESEPPSPAIAGESYAVAASASSNLPVTIESPTPSVCSVSGSTVEMRTEGTCTLVFSQSGKEEYEAVKVERSYTVERKPQVITITSTAPSSATVGGSYTVTATGGASGNPVTFTIDASSGSVCTISGSTVSFVGAGTCTIDANQAGNSQYLPAPEAKQPFNVAAASSSSSSGGSSSSGSSSSNTQPPASTTAVITSTSPKGSFRAVSAMLHSPSYVITLNESLDEAGTLSWLVTFPNGPLGAYTAKNKKCRAGRIRLAGRCLPAKVLFGRGKQTFSAPGIVTITIKPTRAAKRAFKIAKRKHRNIKLTATLTFTSLRGGAPVVHTQVLAIRLARSK